MRPPIIIGLLLASQSYVLSSPCRPDSVIPADTNAALRQRQAATLEVRAAAAGIMVYADTTYLGSTPLAPSAITEGVHVLHFVPPESRSWLSPAVVETLTVNAGEHLVRTVTFPLLYHVTSEPYGAAVRHNGSVVGVTPLDLPLQSTLDFVTLLKEGYDDVTIPLTADQRDVHVLLHAKWGEGSGQQSGFLSREQSKNPLPIFVATGATVLTGAAAAYFKLKADSYYDDYRRTGDEGSLAQVRRLDVVSGITLAASELSLFTLTYFLLSR